MSQIFEEKKNLTISKLTSQIKELLVLIKRSKSLFFVDISSNLKFELNKNVKKKPILRILRLKFLWMSQIFERKKSLTISKLDLQNKELLVLIKHNGALFPLLLFQVYNFNRKRNCGEESQY